MTPIPEPRIPPPSFDPNIDRVRFWFKYLRDTGRGSRKQFSKLPNKEKSKILNKFRQYGRLSLNKFKQSDAVKLRKRKIDLRPPIGLSEDIRDQAYDYFRLGSKCRIFGFLDGRDFLVAAIDPDHEL